MDKLLIFIFSTLVCTECFPQLSYGSEYYENFIGQWSPIEDSTHVSQYGFTPYDFNISLKGKKFEIIVFSTQFCEGILKGKETLLIERGGLSGDILTIVSADMLIWVTTGSKLEFKLKKYFRVKK
ncbi:MAG: hypothetical protein H6559_27720 [Lewinellaceae bacterium]|nr:hypothetical protein [Lewinellaceae bacterium]